MEHTLDTGKRRLPEYLRRFLIHLRDDAPYLPFALRVVWFRDTLGDKWGIRTKLLEGGRACEYATFHAEITSPQGRVVASGHKTRTKDESPDDWCERAESGAVSRALAQLGFGTQFMPDVDDVVDISTGEVLRPGRR